MAEKISPLVEIPFEHQSAHALSNKDLLYPDFGQRELGDFRIAELASDVFEEDGVEIAIGALSHAGLIVSTSVTKAITRELSGPGPHPGQEASEVRRIERLTGALARHHFARRMIGVLAFDTYVADYTESKTDSEGYEERRVNADEYKKLQARTASINTQATMIIIKGLKTYRNVGVAEAERNKAELLLRIAYDSV